MGFALLAGTRGFGISSSSDPLSSCLSDHCTIHVALTDSSAFPLVAVPFLDPGRNFAEPVLVRVFFGLPLLALVVFVADLSADDL